MSRKNNFTLLEVLLAMSALLLLTMLVSTTVYSLPNSYHTLQTLSQRTGELAALDRIADRVLCNAVPFRWRDDTGETKEIFKGDPQLLITAYRMRPDERSSAGLGFLALGLRDKQLVAQFRSSPILWREKKDPMPETLLEEVVLHDVEELHFLYVQAKDGQLTWIEDWNEEESPFLPRAIAFTVKFSDGQTVKYIRRTAGNSLVTTFGRRTDAWK